jgi:hypothetical protein
MKKFIIYIVIIIFISSCSVHNVYKYKGDITLMSDNGNIINKWDNVYLNQYKDGVYTYGTPFKHQGINFITSKNKSMYIQGGVIIIENIHKEEVPLSKNPNSSLYSYSTKMIANELVVKYNDIKDHIKLNKKAIRKLSTESDLFKEIFEQTLNLKNQLKSIERQYLNLTGYQIHQHYEWINK